MGGNVKLYEISTHIRQLLEAGFACDEETGEILWEGQAGFEALQEARAEKILACGKVLAEMRAEREAFSEERKAQAKRLLQRETMMQKREDALRDYIERNAEAGEKFADSFIQISWRKTESVEIEVAPETLPFQFVQVKQTYSADKAALKAALKAGQQVAGVQLVEKMALQVK
jgi:uncharacterized protein YyaL (SSP411 family)